MASLTYDLTLAGLAVGSAAALTGIGTVVTYRVTGVLNLAQGAIAMVTAYVLRESVVEWGWPLWAAAPVVLLLVAPGMGLLLERAVFRSLAARAAGPAETLVASLGVFVLLVGGAFLVWGGDARPDAPVLLPGGEPGAPIGVVVALAAAVGAAGRWTPFGTRVRAVVDDRRLALLAGIDADRVAAAGWAFGAFTAGLAGVLLAPFLRLDPYGLPLLVMETLAVAVAAGLRSTTVAIVVALTVAVAQSQLTRLHPPGRWPEPLLQAVGADLFVIALLVAVVALPAVGGSGSVAAVVPRRRHVRRGTTGPGPAVAWTAAGFLFLLPLGFAGGGAGAWVQVPAVGLILLSLVVVSGLGGQISLGQAAYAGLGALFTALLAAGRFPGLPALPELAALAAAVVLVAPLGLLTGGPAVRRRGLALALATFAFGLAVSRFVLAQPYATAGLGLGRPAGFTTDRAFYALEIVLLALALLAVGALRRGRTGRALAAVGDHEAAAAAAGVRVPALKLLTFVAGAALAALGGGLLGMGVRAFDAEAFDPVRGLLWFAAVVVMGADSALGAMLAAALLVGLDTGVREGVAAAVVGVSAVLRARMPGGLTAWVADLPRGARGVPRPTPVGAAARSRLVAAPAAPASGPPRPASPDPPHRPARERAGGSRLTARGVRMAYDGFTVLDGVDLSVPPGRVTALIGPNGAGKSTLFDCLCGTVRPRAGRVVLSGRDVTRMPPHTRARLGVGRTFQRVAVFPTLDVAGNVRVGAEQGRVRDPAAVERMLRLLGLGGVRDGGVAGLGTGTLRRVELARALAGRPGVLLLDEPAAGLDTAEVAALATVLRALAADGTAVLLVEHDLDLVGGLAGFVYVMAGGRVVAAGRPAGVLADPAVREAL
jgi:branched-chain amino acid transport system permease protein